MSIVQTDKIFVDPNDEVVFIVDAVTSREKEKVLIIIPENALLLSSFITLKILYRELLKSKKITILVTEDPFGLNISQKAGFVTVQKMSQVTPELWDIAFSKKVKAADFLRRKGDKETEEKLLPKIESEPENDTAEVVPENVSEEVETIKEEEVKELEKKKSGKIVRIDGIELMLGGDIALLSKSAENDKMDSFNKNENIMDTQDNVRKPQISGSSFTGKDFTKYVKKESFIKNLFSKKPKRRGEEFLNPELFINKKLKRERLLKRLGLFIVVILTVLFGGWFFIDNYSSIDVYLKVKPEGIKELPAVEITGSVLETQMDVDKKIIPIAEYFVENVSASRTGEATGQSLRGTKAKGLVTVYNTFTEPQPTALNLPVGTKITNVGSNLVFVLLQAVSLEAPELDSSGIYDTPFVEDIEVEAFQFGSEYNLAGEGTSSNFLVDGFESSKVRVTKFTPFAGGTSETYTTVSKENIDNSKNTFINDLKLQAETRIANLIPQGFILINGSTKITEEKIDSIPKENEEAKDKTFNLNITLKAKGYAVRQDYLNNLARALLLETKAENENIDIEEIKETDISFVSESEGKILLSLSSKGSFKNIIDVELIKSSILNKSIEEARAILKADTNFSEIRISYIPFFVPAILQKVPWSIGRITVSLN